MRLADETKKSEDDFKVVLNWRGKRSFAMEPCRYRGMRKTAYTIGFGGMNYYVVADPKESRDDLFEAFDEFSKNLDKCLEGGKNPYTAVLMFENGRLEPVLTVDTSKSYNDQEVLLVFGLLGETAIFGFENSDLRASLAKAFEDGADLHDVRCGSEKALKAVFGEPNVAEVMPPEAAIDGVAAECDDRGVVCRGCGDSGSGDSCGGPSGEMAEGTA